jgi:hypothetical protein
MTNVLPNIVEKKPGKNMFCPHLLHALHAHLWIFYGEHDTFMMVVSFINK